MTDGFHHHADILVYLAFTVKVTENRVAIRKEMVESDNERNGFFIDSILNHETSSFSGQRKETSRFNGIDASPRLEQLTRRVLNLGQSGSIDLFIIMYVCIYQFVTMKSSISIEMCFD